MPILPVNIDITISLHIPFRSNVGYFEKSYSIVFTAVLTPVPMRTVPAAPNKSPVVGTAIAI